MSFLNINYYLFGIAKILLDFLQKKILKRDFVWLATCQQKARKEEQMKVEEELKFIAMVTVALQQCIIPRIEVVRLLILIELRLP